MATTKGNNMSDDSVLMNGADFSHVREFPVQNLVDKAASIQVLKSLIIQDFSFISEITLPDSIRGQTPALVIDKCIRLKHLAVNVEQSLSRLEIRGKFPLSCKYKFNSYLFR